MTVRILIGFVPFALLGFFGHFFFLYSLTGDAMAYDMMMRAGTLFVIGALASGILYSMVNK